MRDALRLVFRLLLGLLWLLLRLAILALTGSWISGGGGGRVRQDGADEEEDGDDQEEVSAEEPVQVQVAPRVPEGALAGLRERARALGEAVAADPRQELLRPFVLKQLPARVERLAALARADTPRARAAAAEAYRVQAELLGYLEAMVEQRAGAALGLLGDADRVAAACFAPLREFADAHQIPLSTRTPVTVRGDWGLSVVSFRDAPIAPIRLPDGFERSPLLWPALAHEVAHDVYFSVRGLEDSLHQRLELPPWHPLPPTARDYQYVELRELLGAWLAELFADTLGMLQMGPAYGEAMLHHFAAPGRPAEVRAAAAAQGSLGAHPPSQLRVRVGAYVLEFMGQHEAARDMLRRWDTDHGMDPDSYFLPARDGSWLSLPAELLEVPARQVLTQLLQDRWPRLASTKLLDIPGFVYLHAEHAQVERMARALARGERVTGRASLVIAAAVLAVRDGAPEPTVMAAMRDSILGVGAGEAPPEGAYERPYPGAFDRARPGAPAALVAAFRDPRALREAIVVGEALRRRV